VYEQNQLLSVCFSLPEFYKTLKEGRFSLIVRPTPEFVTSAVQAHAEWEIDACRTSTGR
jgi:hypothetical protein